MKQEIQKLHTEAAPSPYPSTAECSDNSQLTTMLMGRSNGFQYKLSLTAPLENSFIKNKYFDFRLFLEGPPLDPAEIVPLRIGFYTSEVPPKLITQNINFTKFLKGY